MSLADADGLYPCSGLGGPPHRAAFADMEKCAGAPGGTANYCKACRRRRRRERYRRDEAHRAARLADSVGFKRRRRLHHISALRRACRYRLGVVVGDPRPHGAYGHQLRVVTDAGAVWCVCDPREVGDGEFVTVRTRAASPHRPRGRAHSRTVHRARRLMTVSTETGHRLLALQRAWLWEHGLTAHDRDGETMARHFAGIDLLLARAEGDARRHRRLTEAQDAQDAEASKSSASKSSASQ